MADSELSDNTCWIPEGLLAARVKDRYKSRQLEECKQVVIQIIENLIPRNSAARVMFPYNVEITGTLNCTRDHVFRFVHHQLQLAGYTVIPEKYRVTPEPATLFIDLPKDDDTDD